MSARDDCTAHHVQSVCDDHNNSTTGSTCCTLVVVLMTTATATAEEHTLLQEQCVDGYAGISTDTTETDAPRVGITTTSSAPGITSTSTAGICTISTAATISEWTLACECLRGWCCCYSVSLFTTFTKQIVGSPKVRFAYIPRERRIAATKSFSGDIDISIKRKCSVCSQHDNATDHTIPGWCRDISVSDNIVVAWYAYKLD